MNEVTEKEKELLKKLVDHYDKEEIEIRERQVRSWRKLKLMWDGFTNIWYSEVAHDWRIWDAAQNDGDNQQDFYDKRVNIFRAYLESIIAALSVTVPPIKCYPDDADNSLDLLTAKAGDRIGKLIYRHNDVSLLWLHALFIFCTEGMVACYRYSKDDKEYGTYEKKHYQDDKEEVEFESCSICGQEVDLQVSDNVEDEIDPDDSNLEAVNRKLCPNCMTQVETVPGKREIIVTRLTGVTNEPKTRQCMEVYGGLYVKVANYAKKQADTPYLKFSYETDFTFARDRYPDIRDKIAEGEGSSQEPYERWARTSPQYGGELPKNSVTCGNWWFRPESFNIFDEKECAALQKRFPNGVKVVMVNDHFAEAENESLDDHWSLTENPLSDFIYHQPLGEGLVSIQDITNDLISLVIQTIEHGIPQTIADPRVLNFQAYRESEATPGAIIPGTPQSGKSIGDGFYEVHTATLSPEILPFAQKVQEYGQLVSGALPSLFGGNMTGSKTASEYSMSRAQALQRLQNTWKMFTIWWKIIFSKAIPAYIKSVQEDEKYVEKDEFGNFVNVFIRKAELEGKIGRIELEANENLPITWAQQKDIIMKLMDGQNPQVMAMLAQPENLPLVWQAIGLDDFYIPGEDDREKQNDEIKQLVNSEPILQPPDPMEVELAMSQGMPPPMETELPSVEVDATLDNHKIEFDTCRIWLIGEPGRLAKVENEAGYKNVLLHAMQHNQIMQEQMMAEQQAMMAQQQGSKAKQNTKTPITGEENVQVD